MGGRVNWIRAVVWHLNGDHPRRLLLTEVQACVEVSGLIT